MVDNSNLNRRTSKIFRIYLKVVPTIIGIFYFINTILSYIESALIDILAPISVIDEIYDKISYKLNYGVTFTNSKYRTSVVCINKTTTREELINTITHEADHVQDAICDYYDVPLNSEQAAYLIGYLVGKMYYASRRLFCS